MKNMIVLILMVINIVLVIILANTLTPHTCPLPSPVELQGRTFDDLLDAIEWVESRGDSNAVGDNGRAVGSFQIHHCYIEDVRWGKDSFKDSDRLNKAKSREIVRCYLSRYATYYRLGHYPTFEDFARIHNGGPNGWKKDCTKPYWLKVKARLNSSE